MEEDFFPKDELYNDLYYVTKGREKCAPNHRYGPTMREYYLIHFIIGGKGLYQTKDSIYSLSKGQFFVIYPDEQTFYQADDTDPWEYIWFGFEGDKAEEILNSIGITHVNPVGVIKNYEEVLPQIEKMTELSPFSNSSRMWLQGMLYLLLSHLFPNNNNNENVIPIEKINKQIIYTHDAIELIKKHYADVNFKIGDLSDIMALNESYLTSVFRQVTGQTLHKYLIDYRIQKSRLYLETTDLSVADVSEKIGYANPLSFTRIFKQRMNMTPSEYKKKNKS